jgi:hypothetical protein
LRAQHLPGQVSVPGHGFEGCGQSAHSVQLPTTPS